MLNKIIAILIVCAGITMLSGLWPLPGQLAIESRNQATKDLAHLQLTDSSAVSAQSLIKANEEIIKNPYLEAQFWFQWIIQFILTSCILLSGALMLLQKRFWAISILITTVLYTWHKGFYMSTYHILFEGSVSGILGRLAILEKYPVLFAQIVWFDLAIPLVLFIGSVLAAKFIMRQQGLKRSVE